MIANFKKKIVILTKSLFHYLGFIIVRIPNANKLFDELDQATSEVQRYTLKKLVSNIKTANNQKLYNEILKKFVNEWDNNFTKAEFMGDGLGVHNLCAYRKVRFENRYYFEKVYFNDSDDWMRAEWFYKNVYPILKDRLNVPKLYKVIKGYLITIVYFEFIDFIPISTNASYPVFFNISKRMVKLSKHNEELSENAPEFTKDYTMHHCYKLNVKTAEKTIEKLYNNRVTPKMIEKVIRSQPLMFTHGDIHDRNVFKDDWVIDWDSFGFLPQGFEVAIIFLNNIERPTSFKCFQEILIKEYQEAIHKDLWEGFELSFFYFYFLFTIREVKTSSTILLQTDVFDRIESLYYKKTQHLN